MTETEASYQKAPELEAEGVVVSGKRGKICCGACCDMRRATIVVNIVNLCFLGVALMGMIAALSVSSNLDKYSDDALFDDEFESDLNDLKGLGIVGIFVVLVLVSFFWGVSVQRNEATTLALTISLFCILDNM
mmetsp:Transcript_11711/g.26190  ORF Transcript_11711/g.26190 Transcript_11711/m.26190 type:complete len:133 (-) Transcript_11711:473-871(-)